MRLRDFASIVEFLSDQAIDKMQDSIDERREARTPNPAPRCNASGVFMRPTLQEQPTKEGEDVGESQGQGQGGLRRRGRGRGQKGRGPGATEEGSGKGRKRAAQADQGRAGQGSPRREVARQAG